MRPLSVPLSALLAFLPALAGTLDSLTAQTAYQSHGFEAPTFKLGTLAGSNLRNGQDGWLVTPSGGSKINLKAIALQNKVVRSGVQAGVWDAALETNATAGHLRSNKIFSFKRLSQQIDFRISTSKKPSGAWGIQIQSTPIPASVMAYWVVDVSNEVWVMKGKFGQGNLAWVKTGVKLQRGVWHHAHTIFDTSTDSMTLYIDGKIVIKNNPSICSVKLNTHGFTSIVLQGRGNDAFYFDNFSVRSVAAGPLLSTDSDQMRTNKRGKVQFRLSAGSKYGKRKYLLVGGYSGSAPGIPLPGSSAVVPVRFDPLTNFIISSFNTPMFQRFSGTLNTDGQATAVFDTLVPLPTSLVGVKFTFAYALHSPFDVASDATVLTFVK